MKPKNALQLFLAAFIWGIAFVAQSNAAQYIHSFTFNGIRCMLGAIALLPLIIYRRTKIMKLTRSNADYAVAVSTNVKSHSYTLSKTAVIGGFLCGICLCFGSTLQQLGIEQTTVGKAGFITALYIIFVPVAGAIFLKKKITLPIGISVILGLCGLFTLCLKNDLSIQKGDFYVLLCSFAFTAHILVIDYFSTQVDGVVLSCIQFFVCSLISIPFIILLEKPTFTQIWAARIPILYAGILSCGIAYTLQIVGQKNMNPTISSLILCLESVVSVLAGWIILHQKLSHREILGCIIMFSAIIIATTGDFISSKFENRD